MSTNSLTSQAVEFQLLLKKTHTYIHTNKQDVPIIQAVMRNPRKGCSAGFTFIEQVLDSIVIRKFLSTDRWRCLCALRSQNLGGKRWERLKVSEPIPPIALYGFL